MKTIKSKKLSQKVRRHSHIRRRISGTHDIPRLTVFRSNKHLYAQIIDDVKRVTLAAISTAKIEKNNKDSKNGKVDKAFVAGEKLAEMAKALKIKGVVFDRGGYKYHGRVKAVAEGARKGGLNF